MKLEMLINFKYLDLLSEVVDQFKVSMNQDILGTILHAMANLCSTNCSAKKVFLNHRLFQQLVDLYQVTLWPPEIDVTYAWLFSNILIPEENKGPMLDFERENTLASILCRIFLKYQYGKFPEIDLEALWGIAYYMNIRINPEERISNILSTKCIPIIVLALKKHAVEGGDHTLIAAIVRIVGICTTYSNEVVDMIMEYDLANVGKVH